MRGPTPAVDYGPDVMVANFQLRCQAGSYEVVEAPRFGQKINIGSLKYADFNPYDSAQAVATLAGGYALQAYSDLPDGDTAATMYAEAQNVDTRNTPITLSGKQVTMALPGVDDDPVWGGEFLGEYVVVAGTQVYTFGGTTFTNTGITLPATALKGAIGVFGGNLVIGFGDAATAVYTADLTTTADVTNADGPIYVFAFTADHAAAFVAGGPNTTDVHLVIASTDGILYDSTTAVACGSFDYPITGLAPGGGLVLIYVGKVNEMGAITSGTGADTVPTDATYTTLVPFDSCLPTNCRNVFRWQLGQGGNEQRGPVSLVFSREGALWGFQPSDQTTGSSANISPWASPYLRPTTAKGLFTAIQGSARWLYAAIQDKSGNAWIVVRDAHTGAWAVPFFLGDDGCNFIGITSLFGAPLLLFNIGQDVVKVTLPFDGDIPLDDSVCRFADAGSLWLSDIDLGFPDEDKIAFSVRLNHRGLSTGQTISVFASFDGGTYVFVGIADGSGDNPEFTDMNFDPDIVCKRVALRLDFATDDPAKTPQLHGMTVRLSLNTTLRRLWNFTAMIPAGFHRFGEDLDNPATMIAGLWQARSAGFPVAFRDRWGDEFNVRILALDEKEVFRPPNTTPETAMKLTLLEVGSGAETRTEFDAPPSSGAFIPLTLGD